MYNIISLDLVKDFYFETPINRRQLHDGTLTKIDKSWIDCSFLDKYGRVWVSEGSISEILRTDSSNARERLFSISDNEKTEYNEIRYFLGTSILAILDSMIQEPSKNKTREYRRYSRDTYNNIVDSDKADNLRNKYQEELNDIKKKLKKIRIKEYGIEYDELTGKSLVLKTAEFSHIRSCSSYPFEAGNIENGFIVNKETHDVITNSGINNEDDLYVLCIKLGWYTDWYENY